MSTQLSLLPSPQTHPRPSYVVQGSERPADLPRLRESAATMERRVLEWFRLIARVDGPAAAMNTPSMCAIGLGLKLTTVRPRICQLAKRTSGPRLEPCKWVPRRPTEDGGSEGWFRFKEDEA